jgi:hypothetical protein
MASISSRVLPLVSGMNFQVKKMMKTIKPEKMK